MTWITGVVGFTAGGAALAWALRGAGPRVAPEQVAEEDRDLVRDEDRARWRRLRLRTYRADKKNDDFYRIAAYRKEVAGGAVEAVARDRVRRAFPFYYLDPASRDAEGFAGDDGGLPVCLRERVNRNARILKTLMDEEGVEHRTMNALVRFCLRKGIF